MTAKDYIYLGLLAFSAIAFYWIGFYGGFNTTLKMLQTQEDESPATDFEKGIVSSPLKASTPSMSLLAPSTRQITPLTSSRFPTPDSHFGLN